MSTNTSPASSATTTQLTLVAFLRAKPDQGDELGRRLMTLVDRARAEAGNINYDIHRSNEDPDVWMLYENWKAAGDLEAHFALPYMKEFVSTLGEVLEGDMDLRRFSMTTKVAPPKN
jgi:quinol monooxygenase YgiN